jgi:hypothetical protein
MQQNPKSYKLGLYKPKPKPKPFQLKKVQVTKPKPVAKVIYKEGLVLTKFDYYKFVERVNGRCATLGICPAAAIAISSTNTTGHLYEKLFNGPENYILLLGIFLIVIPISVETFNSDIENEFVDLFEKYLGRTTMLIWGVNLSFILAIHAY